MRRGSGRSPGAIGAVCENPTVGLWSSRFLGLFETSGKGMAVADSAHHFEEGAPHALVKRASRPDRDSELMERIRDDDTAALGELIDTHWDGLVRYAAWLTRSMDEGEDVAQSVFVQVWETRSAWTSSGSPVGYLFRIARNLSVNRMRRARVRMKSGPELARRWRSPASPLDSAALSEFEAALEQAVSDLPERRRTAFILVRFQGLSLDDAGAAMGVARQTVANHLYLASQQLLESLGTFLT